MTALALRTGHHDRISFYMPKTRLNKRLTWYYPTEKFNVFVVFPAIALYLIVVNPIQDLVFVLY